MLDHDLVRTITKGRCFLMVGSGPSCELGFPTWNKLADDVRNKIKSTVSTYDRETYERFIAEKKYPEVFRQAEIDLGGRLPLIRLVDSLLRPEPGRTSETYRILTRWPFQVYLTTNFDNEIDGHLKRSGQFFATLQNNKGDTAQVRADSKSIIFKVHSDLTHPESAVLTSLDYSKIKAAGEFAYLRQKLISIFQMCDIFIIGHSLSDPDLQLILEIAKESSDPSHPIYMAVANVSSGEIRDLLEKYNIRVLPYKDTDGNHSQLKRILKAADRFIPDRDSKPSDFVMPEESRIEAATSLLLFRQTRAAAHEKPETSILAPLVLKALSDSKKSLVLEQLLKTPPLSIIRQGTDCAQAVTAALNDLVERELVQRTNNDEWKIADAGQAQVETIAAIRKTQETQAFGQFAVDLRRQFPALSKVQEAHACEELRRVLVNSFSKRGLEMANVIIAKQSLQSGRLPELFRSLTQAASTFDDFDLRAGFIETAADFILAPGEIQSEYLASISQGFFLYHFAGLDPTCHQIRTDIFKHTAWFLDSSVLLSLFAKGCQSHEFALDFLRRLEAMGTSLFTTEKILLEARQHLAWAISFMRVSGADQTEFLSYATLKAGYKQNLFLDGYIEMSAEGEVTDFRDYLLGVIDPKRGLESFIEKASEHGVRTLILEELEGFDQIDFGELPALASELKRIREERGTYRGYRQVAAEAEILLIIQKVRARKYTLPLSQVDLRTVYFVSQSRVLDAIQDSHDVVTWTPEAVYRYLMLFPESELRPELLQECMLGEFFRAGVSVIDKRKYLAYFGPAVSQAKLSYEEQKTKYLDAIESATSKAELDSTFQRVPDLEKPFFVAQMAWRLTDAAEKAALIARERADEAINRAKIAEQMLEKVQAEKVEAQSRQRRAENEANRLRNLGDKKHLAKRERQRKKKNRRKRR